MTGLLKKIFSNFSNSAPPFKFLNTEQEKGLLEKGYFTISLLNEREVAVLRNIYSELQVNNNEVHTVTLQSQSYEVKKLIYEKLKEYFTPKLNSLFENYKVSGAGFYYKSAASLNNTVPPHQDWTLVDERKFFALNIWVPLVEVDKDNGAYHVIEGSHKRDFTYRGSNVPSACSGIECAWDKLTYIPLKRGEAIIYDVRLIHATPPNSSSNDRISVVINVVPEQADLIHCHMESKDSNEISVYKIDEEFFSVFTLSFKHNTMPDGYRLLRKEKYSPPMFQLD